MPSKEQGRPAEWGLLAPLGRGRNARTVRQHWSRECGRSRSRSREEGVKTSGKHKCCEAQGARGLGVLGDPGGASKQGVAASPAPRLTGTHEIPLSVCPGWLAMWPARGADF